MTLTDKNVIENLYEIKAKQSKKIVGQEDCRVGYRLLAMTRIMMTREEK